MKKGLAWLLCLCFALMSCCAGLAEEVEIELMTEEMIAAAADRKSVV